MESVLVFPSSTEASLSCLKEARKWRWRVIGASSLENDPHKNHYDAWESLPFIHEDNFVVRLQQIIIQHNITALSIPHAPSYLRIENIKELLPNVTLIGNGPYINQVSVVQSYLQKAEEGLKLIRKLTGQDNALPKDFLASLLAHVLPLYGESSFQKIIALCAIFKDAPQGDVIEVGVFFGKSVFVLNRMSAYFNTGATLAVDAWDKDLSIQKESPQEIQQLSEVWNWDLVFQGFLINMQATHAGNFNYLRMSSTQAWKQYNSEKLISSSEFGDTIYKKKIAVLHLDGNHDQASVHEDFKLWSTNMLPGGWIIFDDYEWSQGDGPRKLVDRIRSEYQSRIERFFVEGGAAFIKLKG